MKQILLLISLIFLISACSFYRISSQDNTYDYYPSKESPNDVIYLESVKKPFENIGIVTVNAERRQRISEVIEKMKQEAAILGGDAITEIQTNATGVWKRLPAQEFIGNGFVRADFTAKVIVFK